MRAISELHCCRLRLICANREGNLAAFLDMSAEAPALRHLAPDICLIMTTKHAARNGKELGIFDVQMMFVELRETTQQRFQPRGVPSVEAALLKPLTPDRIDFIVGDIRALMICFEFVDLR